LILHENIYFQHKNKLLDPSTYAAWYNDLDNFIKKQNLWEHWDEMKDAYQSEFSACVTELIKKHKPNIDSA